MLRIQFNSAISMKILKYAGILLIGIAIGSTFHCINTAKRVPSKQPNPIGMKVKNYHFGKMHYKVIIAPDGGMTTINVTNDSLFYNKLVYDRPLN